MIVITDEQFNHRAEVIREKGTNRSAFFRGEVDKYGWVDIGSSFLPSDIIAAFLYAQLENLDDIQAKRLSIWNRYNNAFNGTITKKGVRLPYIPDYATNNAHMFYLLCNSLEERTALIEHLKKDAIFPVFHYLSLHKSEFFNTMHDGRALPNSDIYSDTLLRLPLFYELSEDDQAKVIGGILEFYQ
jgi:dTDP-4-amino-4,6-dideoxygalactose transaminase